jgi:hypothetical protein
MKSLGFKKNFLWNFPDVTSKSELSTLSAYASKEGALVENIKFVRVETTLSA